MKSGKVLIICPFTAPNQGGVESHIQKLLKFLAKKKAKAIVVSYTPLTTPVKAPWYEKKENYEIFRMPWFGSGWFPKIEIKNCHKLLYLVPGLLALSLFVGIKRNKEIGVIHAHGFAAGFVGVCLGALIRKRKVISTHAIYNFENRPLLAHIIKFILSPYDFILAVGEPSRQELIKIGIPENKIAIHPNWVDTDLFKPQQGTFSSERLTAIFVGRGLEKKGIFLFGELAKKNPKIDFIARVAEGPDRDSFIRKYHNQKNLDIRTNLPLDFDKKMKVIRNEYQSADVFIMPSLYAEGFAAVVLEAASSGLAIISSNLGTLPSILNGSGAYLVKPTVENFSLALRTLSGDKETLRKLKRKSRTFALKNYSDKNAEVIYNSYQII
ncbi:MAG: glycosyltransferase family 4 protein [Deltaproteobacteria bacterium]|nr:glycosyltransferase family 4 protein [Deltaproteobacteria bacterium]